MATYYTTKRRGSESDQTDRKKIRKKFGLKRRPSLLARIIGPTGDVLDGATAAIGGVIRGVFDSCVAGAKAGLKDRK